MAVELDEDQRARLNAEWAFLNATREMLNIARRKPDLTTLTIRQFTQAQQLPRALWARKSDCSIWCQGKH